MPQTIALFCAQGDHHRAMQIFDRLQSQPHRELRGLGLKNSKIPATSSTMVATYVLKDSLVVSYHENRFLFQSASRKKLNDLLNMLGIEYHEIELVPKPILPTPPA